MKRVVITGIGIIAPNGHSKQVFWSNLFDGKSFVENDVDMQNMGVKSTVNSKIKNFKIENYVDDDILLKHLKEQDNFIQYGFAAGASAIKDANMELIDSDDCGVLFASAIGGTPKIQKIYENLSNGGKEKLKYRSVGDSFYNAGMVNYPAVLLAEKYGFNSVCTSISTGCTAGLDSVGMCYDLIKNNEAKVMLAGAAEAPLTDITYATLDVIGALCVAEGEPSTRSRPFDKTRAGFVIAEGSACLVVEELEHALARNAKIYGEILAYESSNNTYHMTDLIGDGKSMANTIDKALESANISPDSIDYINAHGSSTYQNDLFETNAFKLVFKEKSKNIPISSTKSMIGHSLSSASAMGVIASLGSIKYKKVHPTINLKNKDEKCDLNYVPNIAQDHDVKKAMVTASGFGGIHSIGIFGEYRGEK
jgi:3-oxoacyl-(acyl-carrier-protein) synthase